MKKLLFLFFALSMMQISGQDLKSISNSATATSGSMIETLASDQAKSLTKKLNLNEAQQDVVSNMVLTHLKSDKFKSVLATIDTDKMSSSNQSSAVTNQIQNTLLLDKDFQKGMSYILSPEQKKAMQDITPK